MALNLLLDGYVEKITINDLDRSIYAFWYSILTNTEKFCTKIKNTEVTFNNWKRFKKVFLDKEKASLFDLGFATFFLNRTNRSGIINGGVIGGVEQKGEYKIDCRFNKDDLIDRIKFIALHKKNIHLYMMDALDLIEKVQKDMQDDNVIFYLDPPYYEKGPSLYMNFYKHDDHARVSKAIKKIRKAKWIVSYDNTMEIKKLYSGCKRKEYALMHTAYKAKEGREILFFSKNLIVPEIC
ncbi:hypothetical protein ES707_05323 [subsurface metagenome]